MHKQYKYDTYITLNPSCLQSPCVCHIKVFDFRGIPSFWGFNSGVSQVGGVSVRHRTNQTAPLSAFALGWDFPVMFVCSHYCICTLATGMWSRAECARPHQQVFRGQHSCALIRTSYTSAFTYLTPDSHDRFPVTHTWYTIWTLKDNLMCELISKIQSFACCHFIKNICCTTPTWSTTTSVNSVFSLILAD